MTIKELYDKMAPSKTNEMTGQILNDGISVNISDIFTRLIKDAARCNSYSSDVYYNLCQIDEALQNYRANYDAFEPIFIGFRRHGVDGNSFILARLDGDYLRAHNEYFALYSVNVVQETVGWVKVIFNEYWM